MFVYVTCDIVYNVYAYVMSSCTCAHGDRGTHTHITRDFTHTGEQLDTCVLISILCHVNIKYPYEREKDQLGLTAQFYKGKTWK